MALTDKKLRFVEEYPIDMNATAAAKRAGYSPRTAHAQGSRLLTDVEVQEALKARVQKVTEEANVTQQDVLRMLADRAQASVAKMVELHRDCCRFCYGKDHAWQETPAERRGRWEAHQALLKVTPEKEWPKLPAFDELGGTGFDPRKEPRDDCPECFGRGEETIIVKDTRKMSRAEASAYQGAKRNRAGGVEVKVTDPLRAIEMLGRYHAMFGADPPPDPNGPQTTGPQPMAVRGVRPKPQGDG